MTGSSSPGYTDPLPALSALLAKSWRIGRLFGIEVRVYWTVVLVYLATVWGVTKIPGVTFESAFLVGLLFLAGIYVVVLAHELGHAFAGRAFRMRTPVITLSPLGGLAHMLDQPPSPRAEILVSLAGPATHGVWLLATWLLQPVVPPLRLGAWDLQFDTMAWLFRLNLWLALFNLLPLFPMDGGRVLRGLLSLRLHPNRATMWAARLGAVGAIGFMAWGMSKGGVDGSLLFLIGLANIQACGRELMMARWSEGPYRQAGAAWELDPDGWKSGSWRDEPTERRPARLGWFARWRLRRRARVLRRPADAPPPPEPLFEPDLEAIDEERELDRLLDRVRDVGMAGLSESERIRLQAISRARQRR